VTRETDEPFVVFPHLQVEAENAGYVVENLVFGTKLTASPDLLTVLEAFARPTRLDAFCREHELPPDSLQALVDKFVLVPASEVGFLAGGLVTPAREQPTIGSPTSWWQLDKAARAGGWVVFGAPYDGAATHAGARYGPTVVRQHAPRGVFTGGTVDDLELRRSYDTASVVVLDLGNVVHGPGESLDTFGARIGKLVRKAAMLGMRPAMIGGDHSLTWFALRELFAHHGAIGVIHFDAHPDLSVSVTGSVLTHANVFSFVLGRPELEVLLQLGLRTLERVEPMSRRIEDPRLTWRSALELRRLAPHDVLGSLRRDLPYYVSFDIDCLDPAIAPETGAPVPGGLDFHQGLELLDYIARELELVGIDMMEVTQGTARTNHAAAIAARYLCQVLLSRAATRPLAAHRHEHHRKP
jgi:agmatinase